MTDTTLRDRLTAKQMCDAHHGFPVSDNWWETAHAATRAKWQRVADLANAAVLAPPDPAPADESDVDDGSEGWDLSRAKALLLELDRIARQFGRYGLPLQMNSVWTTELQAPVEAAFAKVRERAILAAPAAREYEHIGDWVEGALGSPAPPIGGACQRHGIVNVRWIEGAHRCEICGEPTAAVTYTGQPSAAQFVYAPTDPAPATGVDEWQQYHDAVYGEGPMAGEWQDKPHRLVIEMVKHVRATLNAPLDVTPTDRIVVDQATMRALRIASGRTPRIIEGAGVQPALDAHIARCVVPEVPCSST